MFVIAVRPCGDGFGVRGGEGFRLRVELMGGATHGVQNCALKIVLGDHLVSRCVFDLDLELETTAALREIAVDETSGGGEIPVADGGSAHGHGGRQARQLFCEDRWRGTGDPVERRVAREIFKRQDGDAVDRRARLTREQAAMATDKTRTRERIRGLFAPLP